MQRVYPLGDIIRGSQSVAVVTVQSVRKPDLVRLGPAATLKGKSPLSKVDVNLQAKPSDQNRLLLSRLRAGQKMVVFYSSAPKESMVLACLGDAWVRLSAPKPQGPWRFVHFEPYLRRSFHGTADQAVAVVKRVLQGGPAPAPDPKATPGPGLPSPNTASNKAPASMNLMPKGRWLRRLYLV
jgi:hypothetical protein